MEVTMGLEEIPIPDSPTTIVSNILGRASQRMPLLANTLPARYIALQQATSYRQAEAPYLVVNVRSGHPYLAFTGKTKTPAAVHEVDFDESDPTVVTLRAANGKFWRQDSSGIILADRETQPSGPTSDPACYFKLFHDSNEKLLFQSLAKTTSYGKFIAIVDSGFGPDLHTTPFTDTPAYETSAVDVFMAATAAEAGASRDL